MYCKETSLILAVPIIDVKILSAIDMPFTWYKNKLFA